MRDFVTFTTDSPLNAVEVTSDFERIICGGQSGQLYFLRPNAALMRILRGEDDT